MDGAYLTDLWEGEQNFVYCPSELRAVVVASASCGVAILAVLGLALAWRLCGYYRQVKVLGRYKIVQREAKDAGGAESTKSAKNVPNDAPLGSG